MQVIDAADLLLSGVERARKEGAILSYDQEHGLDYMDVRATTRIEGLTRTIFVRCYSATRKLTTSDIENVQVAAKNYDAQMTLVIGD